MRYESISVIAGKPSPGALSRHKEIRDCVDGQLRHLADCEHPGVVSTSGSLPFAGASGLQRERGHSTRSTRTLRQSIS